MRRFEPPALEIRAIPAARLRPGGCASFVGRCRLSKVIRKKALKPRPFKKSDNIPAIFLCKAQSEFPCAAKLISHKLQLGIEYAQCDLNIGCLRLKLWTLPIGFHAGQMLNRERKRPQRMAAPV